MGVFWRKASGRGAFITLASGAGMGAAVFILDFFGKPVSRWLARSVWQAAHTASASSIASPATASPPDATVPDKPSETAAESLPAVARVRSRDDDSDQF